MIKMDNNFHQNKNDYIADSTLTIEDHIHNAQLAARHIKDGIQIAPVTAQIMAASVEAVGLDELSKHVDVNAFWQEIGGLLAQNELYCVRGMQDREDTAWIEESVVEAVVPNGYEAAVTGQLEVGFANRIGQEQGIIYNGNCQIEECLPSLQDVTRQASDAIGNIIYYENPQEFWKAVGDLRAQVEVGYIHFIEDQVLEPNRLQEYEEMLKEIVANNTLEKIIEEASQSPHAAFIKENELSGHNFGYEHWKSEAEWKREESELNSPSLVDD